MQRDSIVGTLIVSTVLCVVCSFFVSTAAVGLQPRQDRNKELDRRKNILKAAGLFTDESTADDIDILFEKITTKIVDLESGEYVTDVNLEEFDQRKAASDPSQSIEIPREQDATGIKRREKLSAVYLVEEGGKLQTLILPVYTKGLWSTMYGFLAFDSDLKTVKGFSFYEHGETPGLGGEVDNPRWKQKWIGKRAYDDSDKIALHVIKGAVNPDSADAPYEVDGLSGATITSRGVTNLLTYWLGDNGFGPYLKKLKEAG